MLLNIIGTIILWNLVASILNYNSGWKSTRLYCGLVGFSGKGKFNLDKIKILLLWNALERGKDSTGIYSPKNDLKKSTDNAYKFCVKNEIIEDNILIAHVRAATRGYVTQHNAHPFVEENVILAHNGTLTNEWAMFYHYELTNAQNYKVDSHIVAACLNKAKNFKPLSAINGPAAFLIGNKGAPDTLFVFRNDERPLYKGFIDGDMYISSIEESLEYIGCIHIKEFKKDTLYTIKKGIQLGEALKLKNDPVKHPNIYNSSLTLPDFEDSNRTWVKASRNLTNFIGDSIKVTEGKWYLVVDTRPNRQFIIVDDDKKEKAAPIYAFDWEKSIPKEGEYVKIIYSLDAKVTKAPIFKEKEIVKIEKVNMNDLYVSLISSVDKKTYKIHFEMFRMLTGAEKATYLLSQNPEFSNSMENNLDFLNNQGFGMNDMPDTETPIVLNDNNALDEDSDDEEPEEEDVDLIIEQKELVAAFDALHEDSEKILEYGNKVIAAVQIKKFNDLVHGLQSKLYEYNDYFIDSAQPIEDEDASEEKEIEDEIANAQNHE